MYANPVTTHLLEFQTSSLFYQLFILSVGASDYKEMYDEGDFQEAEHSINLLLENNCVYQDYFSYSAGVLELESPRSELERGFEVL